MTYFPELSTRRTVILEVTPSVTLSSWSDTAGHVGVVYELALSNFFNSELYRRVVGVRQNGTDLTERSSIATVAASAESYWWDEANALLYVRPTSGDAGDYVMQAFVTYYFATDAVVLNRVDDDPSSGIYYHPWIIGELPNLTRQVSDLLFGITVVETGDVMFTNGHGHWHYLCPGHNWKRKKARVLMAEYEATPPNRSDFVEITTMLIEDVKANEVNAKMVLRSIQGVLEKQIPSTPFGADEYPSLGSGVAGTFKMLGWGRATVLPDLTDNNGYGVYTVADAAYQTLFAVYSVAAIQRGNMVDTPVGTRVSLTEGAHYSVDLTACTITLLSPSVTWEYYDIECDVSGKPDGAGSYIKTFAGIVEDILLTHVGVAAADIDTVSFDNADLENDAPLAVWLKTPRTVASIFSSGEANTPSLERSVLGTIRHTLAGKWNLRIWNATVAAPTVSLVKSDFVSFLPDPRIESVMSAVVIYYAQNHSTNDWSIKREEDLRGRYLAETREEAELYTFLAESNDAVTLASRAAILLAAASVDVEFELRGSALAETLAGDFVTVTYSPAPVPGQAFDAASLELQRLDISLFPTLVLKGKLGDLRSVGNRIGRVTDDTAPDWASATDAEKAVSGFVTDDAGLIDPADPSTADLSIVW